MRIGAGRTRNVHFSSLIGFCAETTRVAGADDEVWDLFFELVELWDSKGYASCQLRRVAAERPPRRWQLT